MRFFQAANETKSSLETKNGFTKLSIHKQTVVRSQSKTKADRVLSTLSWRITIQLFANMTFIAYLQRLYYFANAKVILVAFAVMNLDRQININQKPPINVSVLEQYNCTTFDGTSMAMVLTHSKNVCNNQVNNSNYCDTNDA